MMNRRLVLVTGADGFIGRALCEELCLQGREVRGAVRTLKSGATQRQGIETVSVGSIAHDTDWVAGMFMVYRREVYDRMGGFDERFFLYYEDVDMCARLRLAGCQVALEPTVRVVHYTRRDSHINPRHFLWHVRSMFNFFCSRVFLKTRFGRKSAGVTH